MPGDAFENRPAMFMSEGAALKCSLSQRQEFIFDKVLRQRHRLLTKMWPILDQRLVFPDPRSAKRVGDLNGLVAMGGDLSVPRLVLAYRSGIFPWTSDPVSWWSPDPRAIIELDQFHVPRRLAKTIRQGRFKVTYDAAFRQVMESCATPAPGRSSSWIGSAFVEAYTRLHSAGYAHSVECWQNGMLAGGIYGVSVGGLFAGESMFHRVSNASNVALAHLVGRLRERGFALFDIQMITPHTRRMGAIEISRDAYLDRLRETVEMACKF
jgi:leucyl/phenylalanyl-tRNA---protein transferase